MPPQLITVIGSLNMDIITIIDRMPDGGESLTAAEPLITCPGGKGANQAMAAFRLSRDNPNGHVMARYKDSRAYSRIEVRMIGRVGDDDYGTQLLDAFHVAGLSADSVQKVHGLRTGVAVILVESGTGESRVLLHPEANHSLRPSEFMTLQSLLGNPGAGPLRKPDLLVLQLEIPRDTVEQILETAKREDVEVVLNAAPAISLMPKAWKGVTHLIVNETEGAILLGRDIESIDNLTKDWAELTELCLRRGVKNVVVTLGAKGAYYWNQESGGDFCQADRVEVVDTTTAGDTFVGAYAVEVLNAKEEGHWDIGKAVRRACKAATRTVMKKGTQNSIPWRDEVLIEAARY
jgi:ribokinase